MTQEREHTCGCGTTAYHEPDTVCDDGSGYSTCPGCQRTQVWPAGTWAIPVDEPDEDT